MVHPESTAPHAVTKVVTVELMGAHDETTLQAELQYTSRDPYAASIRFLTGQTEVVWTFGRDLLVDGLCEPTGLGDVHLRPYLDPRGHAVVIIELHSPAGGVLVQAPLRDLEEFVDQMTTLVRPGAESQHIDIDATVAAILAANPIK